MHLMEILQLRSRPASAIFLGLTRRCPLTCRHCSTNSLMTSDEHPEEIFTRFVGTFTESDHPELVLMSGGEALLRPRLVERIARRCAEVGTRTYLLSGMFFARNGAIADPIRAAIDAVDHFAASLDVFHEEQVSRSAVLDVLGRLAAAGKDVSLQLVGLGDDDPYLAEATAQARAELDDRVPMLVGLVGSVGRAAQWMETRDRLTHQPLVVTADPCGLAAWPIVGFDGTVVACCNQSLVDNPATLPAHLRLGHATQDDWPAIRSRSRDTPMLRIVRTYGPALAAERGEAPISNDYCGTCAGLSAAGPQHWAGQFVSSPNFPVLEETVRKMQDDAGPVSFASRHGSRRYASLIELGYQRQEDRCAV